MKNLWVVLSISVTVLLVLYARQSVMAITVIKSVPVSTVEVSKSSIPQKLVVTVKNVSDNKPAADNKMTFPSGLGVVTSPQYMEVSFQSNTAGARIIVSTNNRGTGAGPAFCSGPDGKIGTRDDEPFHPETGVCGAGLVGCSSSGHGYCVPVLWAVFDDVVSRGYTFTGNLAKEGVVTDKAQTHTWAPDPKNPSKYILTPMPFISSQNIAYATVVCSMNQDSKGNNTGLIASFPTDEDGTGPKTGMRSATSPVYLYMGANYTGSKVQTYATSTLKVELINQ